MRKIYRFSDRPFFLLILILLCFSSIAAQAQVVSTSVFEEKIHSLQVFIGDWELHYPILELGSDEVFSIHFDDFSQPQNTYNYMISFCNADWTISDLMKSDYLAGFDEQMIDEYEFSSNTTLQYTHYQLALPNQDVQFLIPGNYLLEVYKNYNPDSIVFTQQLWVFSNMLETSARMMKPSDPSKLISHQQVNIEINDVQHIIRDVFLDVQISIMQNFRPDRQNLLKSPTFIKGNTYIYQNKPENLFAAGTEFLHFDTKSIRFKEMRTDSITFDGTFYHFYIQPDELLPYRPYSSAQDLNGNFRIQLQNEKNSLLLADYVFVHLFAENNKYIMNHQLFTIGQFNSWKKSSDFSYNWNSQAHLFENVLFLKQGYYNYLPENLHAEQLLSPLENHAETENEYFIFVYLKDKTLNFDKLAGFLTINSHSGAN